MKGLIAFTQRGVVKHYGVLTGDGRVIEHAGKEGGMGQLVTLDAFGRGLPIYYIPHRHPLISADEAVRRAAIAVSRGEYSLLTNNCEHRARWAVNGERKSGQVTKFAALSATGAIVGASIARNPRDKAFYGLMGFIVGGLASLATN